MRLCVDSQVAATINARVAACCLLLSLSARAASLSDGPSDKRNMITHGLTSFLIATAAALSPNSAIVVGG